MTAFQHSLLDRTRATSSWLDELWMIECSCVSGRGQISPTASRGFFNFCSSFVKTFVCRFLTPLHHQLEQTDGLKISRSRAELSNTHMVATDCDLIRSDTGGRKRFEHTLTSRPPLARRFQLNQGALLPVEFDRACAARRK